MESKIYKVEEVAGSLDVSHQTLRRWMQNMAKCSYPWVMNEHGHRHILERDLLSLRKMKEYLMEGITIEGAARSVVKEYGEDARELTSHVESDMRIKNLEEKVDALMKTIQFQGDKNDRLLNEVLRLVKEKSENQIAATEEKRGWFSFFKRRD